MIKKSGNIARNIKMNDKEEIANIRNEARAEYKLKKSKISFYIYDFSKSDINIYRKNNIIYIDCQRLPIFGQMRSIFYQYCIRPEQLIIETYINDDNYLVILLLDAAGSNNYKLDFQNYETN